MAGIARPSTHFMTASMVRQLLFQERRAESVPDNLVMTASRATNEPKLVWSDPRLQRVERVIQSHLEELLGLRGLC